MSVQGGIGELRFDQPSSEVNILTSENLTAFARLIDEMPANRSLEALLITSAKPKIFIAGADIKEIEGILSSAEAFSKAEEGKIVLKKLERLSIPTVCVINGACLGGGYELALSCRYRIASFSPNVKIGLPEVNLGILPGFGGSIRLPRLLGLLKALPLILAGRIVSAEEALKIGMVDRLFPEKSLLEDSTRFVQSVLAGDPGRRRSRKPFMTRLLEDTLAGGAVVFGRARKDVLSKTKGHYPAPLKIIELVSKTYGKRSDRVYQAESRAFAELGASPISKNLIKVFYLAEKYKKFRWNEQSLPGDGVHKCGVIGAGVMGGGVAQAISSRDVPVRVKDINDKALGGALKEAMDIYKGALKRKKIKRHELENRMALISVGLTNAGLQNCDLIIEAVIEDLGIKRKVFKELSELTGPETILASNTSSLSVSRMAEGCRYPERIVGLHFFNPVNRMPLVEVIRAEKSSSMAVERTVLFSRRLGKTPIVVADRPGFLVNRLLLPYMNEAAYLLEEGYSSSEIDAIVEAFGMPMGPVELVDQVGIDVGYKVAHILEQAFGERMKVAGILKTASDKKLLGKKGGIGFYSYNGKRKRPNPVLILSGRGRKPSATDALKRMLYVMINEAARCLDEKVADSAQSVDIGMIMGTGFPPFRGGLLRYADSIGPAAILKDLERFQKEADPKRFEPSEFLRRLGQSNAGFGDRSTR
ncbi:MAG: hypothetical protein A3D28_02680 [Omnitrophica bacterium RIFCSPHIGHO2_02_FULL_63_14]|nr:MAG: hypothetical protein A3D28_02680 [Omnitrophica bacterium RIFCSPHIGHO2_02_FULL_63_14]